MNIHESTRGYEAWLRRQIKVVPADLRYKHQQMKVSPFLFLRATFYRWAQLFQTDCPDPAKAPQVLGVGDLHVENFGTWRDAEGRLVWGVNDFDEAHRVPYTNDLTRLAASAIFAIQSTGWTITPRKICELILRGYTEYIGRGGAAFVLEEHHRILRVMATSALRRPPVFWERFQAKLTRVSCIPKRARKALDPIFPTEAKPRCYVLKKPKGLGSLGHRRYIALADWEGALIARETKELAPSAWIWARGLKENGSLQIEKVMARAIRGHDPFFHVRKGWVARRLGPQCSRIDLETLDDEHDETLLLTAMGSETANVHCGDPEDLARIRRDLARRAPNWLYHAATVMVEATSHDWEQWRARR